MNEYNKSIKKNFIFNVLLTVSSFIFPIITFPYISRVLGPAGTGQYNFASSVVNYFSMFAMLGIPTYGIRACAKARDDREKLSKVVSELFFISIITTALVCICFIFAVLCVDKLYRYRSLLFVIGFSMVLNVFGMEWAFKGLEQYSYITTRSIIFKFISVVLMFFLVKNPTDVVLYALIFVIANSGSFLLNYVKSKKYYSLHWGNLDIKQHIKPIIIFFAMTVATTVYTNLDNVMLGFMTSDAEVGYYSAAVKIKYILASIVSSLGAVLLPRASNYLEKNMKNEFIRISQKAINFVCVVAIPISLFFILFAKEGILFIAGNNYINSVLPMQVIMPTVFFIGLTNIMGIQMLVPMGKEKTVLVSELVGAVVDLILNAILIPEFGALGAAIGTLVAEIMVSIVQFLTLKKVAFTCFASVKLWKIIFATALAMPLSLLVKHYFETRLFLCICACACLYFGVYGIVLIILKEDMVIYIINTIKKSVMRR